MNMEKMGTPTPKREVGSEIDAGVQEYTGPSMEEEMLKEREEKLYGSLASIERSHKDFLDRIKNELPSELKDLTPEMLIKLDRAGLGWYNYNNAFYKDANGRPHTAQSGVAGHYGLPEDPKDLFVFNHLTFSETQWGEEAYLYGETDDLENIPEEFDIVPDWITIEKLRAKMGFLKSQGYETNSDGIDAFLTKKHKANEKLHRVMDKYRVGKNTYLGSPELNITEEDYAREFNPDMTTFFGLSEEK